MVLRDIMIRFENYQVRKSRNYLKLSAEALLYFDRIGEEDYTMGVPESWNLEFLKKVNIDQFDLYFICTKTIPHGQYNRVTDYKRVWGLNHLEKGEYDNLYENKRGRVYFGIKKATGKDSFMQGISPVVLLLPSGSEIDFDELFNYFKNSEFDFEIEENEDVLFGIQRIFSESILLRYCVREEVSMSIYGRRAELFFSNEDAQRWEKTE